MKKTKRPWPTADWQATLDDMKREEAEAFRKMLERDASAGDGAV